MNEELWAGPDLKVGYGLFHLQNMQKALDLPDGWYAAYEALRTFVDTGWQRSLYPHFDAFLMTLRSVPEIIRCCFGVDRNTKHIRPWFNQLPPTEQAVRQAFQSAYEPHYQAFRALPLSTERHTIEHRSGVANVKVTITGPFGIVHVGGPAAPVPLTETREIAGMHPDLAPLLKPRRVHPGWQDFTIDGRPLFAECQQYLDRAGALVNEARQLSIQVHGTLKLTPPPS
jgi:hypothetical protein